MLGQPVLLGRRHALALQAVPDVLAHRVPGEERVFLEHHRPFPAGRRDQLAADAQFAARRLLEAREQVEERRLAAAAWSDDGEELVALDLEVDVVQRQQRLALDRHVHLAHVRDADLGHRYCPRCHGMTSAASLRMT